MKKKNRVTIAIIIGIFIAIFIVEESHNAKYYEDSYDTHAYDALGLKLAQKNNDWSKYYLSKSFKEKYNEKDGIFGDMQFDKVEYRPYNTGKYPFEECSYLVVTQGLKKTVYIFSIINVINGLDIYWGDIIYLTDENGNELDARVTFNQNNYGNCFTKLVDRDEDMIAVSDNFYKKYLCFNNIFIHYSHQTEAYFIPEKSSWDKKEAYFKVLSEYECLERHYVVNFTIDEKGYLDDVKVNLVGEYPCSYVRKEKAGMQVFYKHSNWDSLMLNYNFIKKYENKNSIYDDIDEVDIDRTGYDFYEYDPKNHEYDIIVHCVHLDGSKHWLYLDFTYEEKGLLEEYLEDAEILTIDYNGSDYEEAKQRYREQYK